jgi:hypothetical protein
VSPSEVSNQNAIPRHAAKHRACHCAAGSARRRERCAAAKTAEPDANLGARSILPPSRRARSAVRVLPLMVDIRDEERVAEAVRETADKFGGIDILINRPSYSGGHGFCAGDDLNESVADPPTGVRADRRPPRSLLWDRRWHPSRAERRPAVPPIKVRRHPGSSLSPSAGRRCLQPGTPCLSTSSRALIKRIYTGARGALLPLVCLGQRRFRR